MFKSLRVLLALALVSGSVVLPGCSGGSSSINNVAKYAGNYNGTFDGFIIEGHVPVSGTVTLTADSSGHITGTVTQLVGDNFSFPISGTVSSDGHVSLTAHPTSDQATTLTVTISNASTGAFTGTFTTTLESQVEAGGTVSGARTSTNPV
ncbi:hypothetical protein IAD21_02015 [Abditibacteriota bacterium]|nr:hypothetical protein IAD21_02015 [Abditibacteriota bacterium]